MECGKQNIKIVEGNEFALVLPLKQRTFVASTPIDEDIVYADLQDVVLKIGDTQFTATLETYGVQVLVPYNALPRGTYDILLTATYHGSEIRASYFEAITRVQYNSQSDAQQYIAGSPIVLDAAYVIGGTLTDAELEALKEEYREKNAQLQQAIEDAEEAKREWEQKAADIDGVAQQGSNPEATNTAILEAVQQGGGTDIAKESTSQQILTKIGNPASGQAATLFGAIGDVALSAQTLQSLADSWSAMVTNRASLAGYTFVDPNVILSAGDIMFRQTLIKTINDDTILSITKPNVLQNCTNLQSISLNNVTSISGADIMRGCSSLTTVSFNKLVTINSANFLRGSGIVKINFPECTSLPYSNNISECGNLEEVILPKLTTTSSYEMTTCAKLKKVYMPMLNYLGGACFGSTPNLIDITFGSNITANININAWSPTNALSSSSTSLVDEGETFTSNLEKLLYNIRNHIAANLPDRTGLSSLTITFSSAVKAAIQADTATANAFANKNWIIA